MKVGIAVTDFSWPVAPERIGPIVSGIAKRADQAGFDSLWTMDHFFQIRITGLPPESPMPEAYSTLAFMAAQTKSIQLGTTVTSVAYRHPAVLIKAVTTLDVLSGGRMVLGVGAGAPWNSLPPGVAPRDVETYGLGIPFPSLAERFERLEELLQIAHQMWSGDDRPYEGKHYQLLRPLNSPPSLQRPHPPILIGGSGERKTLRLVARYGDMCNLFDLPGTGFQDDLKRKLEVLGGHCQEVGRDYDTIEKTASTLLETGKDMRASVDRFVEHLSELGAIGVQHVIISPRAPWDDATLETLGARLDVIRAIPTDRAA
jgi:F420-dependent oxidoreductase-like protein